MTRLAGISRYLKEMLLAASFALALPAMLERLSGIDGPAGAAAFLVLLGGLWAALLTAAYVRPGWLRWPMAALLAGSAFSYLAFERVTTQFMTYDVFINLLNSAAFIDDALVQNRTAFIGALPSALLLLFALGLAPRRRLPLLPGWLVALAPALGTGALAALLFVRGGDGARGLPPSFTPIAYLALAGYEGATGALGPRQPVRLPLSGKPLARDIVLIIDESVAGQYLDINSPQGVPTPLSRGWPGVAIHNYGLAASITNCSVGTNVTLRHGGTRADYQRINATMPPVWAYAKKAGLRTVYIDAQRTGGTYQNLMDDAERALIDRFVQFDGVPVEQRDMAAARALVKELADPAPKFILVNKVGAHFPVHDKYPDAYLRYRPALPRGRFTDITDTGSRDGFGGTSADWVEYRNAYRNTLLWNVGAFFSEVLGKADLSRATLIYTADHGQNLHERGNPGLFTHCSAFPEQEEGVVPLVLIDGARGSGIDWGAALTANHDRSSHYMIFPTLLALMGYDGAATRQAYGTPMQADARDPGSFNTLFNARLNRKPVWMRIDPARVVQPPASDAR